MNRLVYLYELDSVRNSPEEIFQGQWALFEEIVKNGNQVVLTFNQLTDSKAFLAAVYDKRTYHAILELFKKGVIKVSRYGNVRTASQYIQQAIEKCMQSEKEGFIFSGIPVLSSDKELLEKISWSLKYSDPSVLTDLLEKECDSKEQERLEYIVRFVRMILILSAEDMVSNPVKADIKWNFVQFLHRILELLKKQPDKELQGALCVLEEIWQEFLAEGETGQKAMGNRTAWLQKLKRNEKATENVLVERIIHLGYNYAVEESVADVSKHFFDMDDDVLLADFLQRLEQYGWESKAVPEKLPPWETALRLWDGEKKKEEIPKGLYEETFASEKRKWLFYIIGRMLLRFGVIILYVILFCVSEQVMNYVEDFLGGWLHMLLQHPVGQTVLDILLFGILGSVLSTIFHLPDILECVASLGNGVKDIWVFATTKRGRAYYHKRGEE